MRAEIYLMLPGLTGVFHPSWKGRITPSLSDTLELLYKDSYVSSYKSHSFEERMIEHFKLSTITPWAWFGLIGEGFKIESPRWLKLDIQTSHRGVIQDYEIIKQVAEDFANEFSYAENAIITQSGGWYLSVSNNKQIRSESIWSSKPDFDNINFGLQGADAEFWQERFIEASEWLFAHPLNKERIEENLPVMELIHPWGFANIIFPIEKPKYSVLFSDNPIYRGMANHMSIASFSRSYCMADLEQMTINHRKICIIEDRLAMATSSQNFESWNFQRLKIERELIKPCIEAVQSGIVDNLIVDDGLGTVLQYKKGLKLRWGQNKYSPVFQELCE